MSSNGWLTSRQKDLLENGSTITENIKTYIKTWEQRCYCDGIPDDINEKLRSSGRVPSYKSIAIAILKNDAALKSLGFSGKRSKWYKALKNKDKKQSEMAL